VSDTPKGLRQLKNLAECENERLQGVLNAEQKELRELKEYLHVVVDEDGEHYRDWVADCQRLEAALAAAQTELAAEREAKRKALLVWLDALEKEREQRERAERVEAELAQSRQAALPYVVEYRRKDQAHQWIPMAAFDQQTVAEKYAAPPQSGDWPWEYRVAEAATQPAQDGMVLVPRDILARVLTAHGCSTVDWDAMRELQKLWIPLATAPDTKPTDGRKKP